MDIARHSLTDSTIHAKGVYGILLQYELRTLAVKGEFEGKAFRYDLQYALAFGV